MQKNLNLPEFYTNLHSHLKGNTFSSPFLTLLIYQVVLPMLGSAHSPVKMPRNSGQDGKIPGGWGTPLNSPYGEALPELIGAFSGFRYSCIRKRRDFTC